MSGYSSKAEAYAVLKQTIPNVAKEAGLPQDVSAYYVARIAEDVLASRGHRYGWGLDYDSRNWEESMKKNLRPSNSKVAR